jgi:hypothetical protein
MSPGIRKAQRTGWQIQKLYGYIANRATPILLTKLRHWLSEGKTLFTVIVFPPADHEWEKTQEGEGLLDEVLGQEAKFPFNGAKPWMEVELNRLADDGWHVSVVYPYQFKEQLKLFILLENHHGRSGCSALHMLHHQFMGQ